MNEARVMCQCGKIYKMGYTNRIDVFKVTPDCICNKPSVIGAVFSPNVKWHEDKNITPKQSIPFLEGNRLKEF